MSSKKKVVREKSAEESSSPPKSFKFLLTATRAAVVATNNYPPCTDAINAFSARPYGAMNEADWKPRTEWEQLPPPVSVLTDIKKLIHGQAIWDDSRESASSPVSISQQEVLCQHITRGKLTHFWRREVSQRLASPLLYPHHSLGFDLSVSPSSPVGFGLEELRSSSPSKVALITANLIRAILRSHTNLCNTHADAQDPAYNPINNYEVLLGHSFYPVGYTGPEVERPGVSFGVQESSPTEDDAETEVPQTIGAGSSALPATATTDLKLVTHYDTLHINVCCGAFYYKVEILDGEKHTIKDERSIAADLDRIMQHAKEADMLKQHVVSAAVQEDFDDFYALLARTSAVTDVSDADLHRRLREVSPANAYALNALESGLFTVVLGGPLNPGRRERQSQWLHSMLSIYVSTDEVGYFEMRAHALAVSMATLQTFFLHVMSGISYSDSIDTPLRGARMKPSATPKLVRVSSSPAPTADSEVASRGSGEKNDKNTGRGTEASPAVALSESAQFFEMWLPLKHRVPLRPYEPISPTPQWFTLHAERFQCVADLCLHVVLAAERLRAAEQQSNNPESAPARPRVFFVAHTPNCTAPSAVLLYSPAVEKYIQAVRSQSVLITSSLREDARRTAAASISELMETCLRYPYPLYSMARCLSSGAPQLGVMSRADVCISVNLLTQQFMSGNGPQVPVSSQKPPFKVLRCTSQLGITADMYVNITAQQEKVQKQPILGDGGIAHAEVGYLAPYASSGERLMQMLVPSPS